MKEAIQEKRKHKRTRYVRPVEIQVGKEVLRAAAMDLSGGGIGIMSDELLPRCECVVRNKALKAKGRILYSEEKRGIAVDRTVFRCGIVFLTALREEEAERLLVTP